MSKRSAKHATFAIERTYPASPARVFAAWAQPDAKRRWFACHDGWRTTAYELDFRVGGRERLRTGPEGGTVHSFDGVYQDIVPDERIVYSYDMHLDDKRISVSLATVEFKPASAGGKSTRLVFTEQGVFLDGYDGPADREEGTRELLKSLDGELRR
jgi:uncharacterized protein YndB with AHSA1/START domain